MIVDPKNPSDIEKEVTKDVIMMFAGWDSDVAMEYGKGGHPRDVPDYYAINGKSFPMSQPLRVKEGDVLRIRLFSASAETAYHLHGHDVLVTHKDGLPLDSPYWADVVDVSMGARIDVIARMNNPGRWINHDHIEQHTSNSGKMPAGAIQVALHGTFKLPAARFASHVNRLKTALTSLRHADQPIHRLRLPGTDVPRG